MKKSNLIKALFLGTAITFSSCKEIEEGNIVKKIFEPENNYIYLMPVIHRGFNNGSPYNYFMYIPMWMHDDADYMVTIQNVNNKGKLVERTIYISKERFDTLKTGDYFCVDGNCYTEDVDEKIGKATKEEVQKYGTKEDLEQLSSN